MPPKKKSFLGRKTKRALSAKRAREEEDEVKTQERLELSKNVMAKSRGNETEQETEDRKLHDRESKKKRLQSMKKSDLALKKKRLLQQQQLLVLFLFLSFNSVICSHGLFLGCRNNKEIG